MPDTPAAIPGDTDDLSAFETVFRPMKAEAPKAEVDTKTEEVEENAEELESQDEEAEGDDTEAEVSADDEDAGEETEEAEEPEAKAPKKNRTQERIDELTAARKTAERATELERQQREALERRIQELEARQPEPAKTQPAAEVKGPTPDDQNADGSEKYPLGELDPTFIRDLTRFTIHQESERARIETEERNAAAQRQQQQLEIQTQFRAKAEAVKATLPDFDDNVKVLQGAFQNVDASYGDYLASTIMSMDHGPEVLYFLSQNLPEARKILESGAVKATIALGRLEAQFAGTPTAAKVPPKKVTQAKTPPKAVRGSGGKFTVAADTDDLDAFEKQFYPSKKRV